MSLGGAFAYSSSLRRARDTTARLAAAVGLTERAPPPPSSYVGIQRLPVLGTISSLRAIIFDPVGLVTACRARSGDVFTIHIPMNPFDLTYLLTRDGYRFILDLPPETARMGKVFLNVPTVGFWFPKSSDTEEHLQSLILAGRAFIADPLLREGADRWRAVAERTVDEQLSAWGDRVDLGEALVRLIHEAACRAVVGDALWERIARRARPALRAIADGIDVARVTLAKTPLHRAMREYRGTWALRDVLVELTDEHRRTGRWELVERLSRMEVAGRRIDPGDVPWMLMYVLWNAVTYPGAYGLWGFADILAHEQVHAEVLRRRGAERETLLGDCLQETMRLHPVSSLPRYLLQPVEYETDGRRYRIPAGNYLAASPFQMCHDAQTYADPERYDPFRYARGAPAPALFGRGAFGCVAQGFSRRLLVSVLARLLERRRFALEEPLPSRRVRIHLTYPRTPIRARVAPATAKENA